MPGLDLTGVSSNWKKLQAQLGSEKQKGDIQKSPTLKRKRSEQKVAQPSAFKKFKAAQPEHDTKPKSKRGMGAWFTKPQPNTAGVENGTTNHSRLLKEHDLTAQDIAAAYGSKIRRPRSRNFHDDVNGGLHPTHKAGKYIALDCEMVGTGPPPHKDNVLARASLVNYDGDQIYDSYVQAPDNIEVEDYRTFVSGIKATHMQRGYARTYAEVQADVARLLDGRILVGHALKNDLDVLKLGHPRRDLRDTSRHPKFRIDSRGKPPALRKLAKSELGLDVQTGEHSSVEDARTAMLLFRQEKQGFEEENRKHFGRSRTQATFRAVNTPTTTAPKSRYLQHQVESGDDDPTNTEASDDESEDYLDGELEDEAEEDADADNGIRTKPKSKPKKKTKRKKRTKRK